MGCLRNTGGMAQLPIRTCAFVHSKDVQLGRVDANKMVEAMDVCVGRATLALQKPLPGYTPFSLEQMALKFQCMKATVLSVRRTLNPGCEDPTTVDALAIARLNVEDLYTLCLMFEHPKWVTIYLQDGWRKTYVRHLLQAEETKHLRRFDQHNTVTAPETLDKLRTMIGVTGAQVATIHAVELGTPMPTGIKREQITRFPLPSGVIEQLQTGPKRTMLERLYIEYRYLSSFTHGLNDAMFFKLLCNALPIVPHTFSPAERKEMWQREIAERSLTSALLSLAQATAELSALYPADAELRGAATKPWDVLADGHLLGQAIWNIRTRKLLGVLDFPPQSPSHSVP